MIHLFLHSHFLATLGRPWHHCRNLLLVDEVNDSNIKLGGENYVVTKEGDRSNMYVWHLFDGDMKSNLYGLT